MIAPEVRLDMSLDDVIKANKKAVKAAATAKPAKKDGKTKGKAGLAKPTTPRPNTPGASSSGTPNKLKKLKLKKIKNSPGGSSVISNQTKAVKSVGIAKVKRAAKANQKRGINATGQASKKDIAKAVVNAGKKLPKSPIPAAGLKISFKPSDLGKTTDKNVANQIKAVLAKSSPNQGNNNSNKANKQKGNSGRVIKR